MPLREEPYHRTMMVGFACVHSPVAFGEGKERTSSVAPRTVAKRGVKLTDPFLIRFAEAVWFPSPVLRQERQAVP